MDNEKRNTFELRRIFFPSTLFGSLAGMVVTTIMSITLMAVVRWAIPAIAVPVMILAVVGGGVLVVRFALLMVLALER